MFGLFWFRINSEIMNTHDILYSTQDGLSAYLRVLKSLNIHKAKVKEVQNIEQSQKPKRDLVERETFRILCMETLKQCSMLDEVPAMKH